MGSISKVFVVSKVDNKIMKLFECGDLLADEIQSEICS
jgi:hypothetical protein